MKKINRFIIGVSASCIILLSSCSNEDNILQDNFNSEINFSASISDSQDNLSRAFSDEKKEISNLRPLSSDIYVRSIEEISGDKNLASYEIKSGVYGAFEKKTDALLTWPDKTLKLDFYAWTEPRGVKMLENDLTSTNNTGTVDFSLGNINENESNGYEQYDSKKVRPLENFIAATKMDASYADGKSVILNFKHIVSKLSINVKTQWSNQDVTDNAKITFLNIKDKWAISQEDGALALHLTNDPISGYSNSNISFDLNKLLDNSENSKKYRTIYLPPLINDLNTSFAQAGDFMIEYDGEKYFGSINDTQSSKNKEELLAGEHMVIDMQLTKSFGVGLGNWNIKNWEGPVEYNEYVNPQIGIYSLDDLITLQQAIESGITISNYINSGTLSDPIIIKLYNNITLPSNWTSIGTSTNKFTGIFDAQGYTITCSAQGNPLFGYTDGAKIKNILVSCSGVGDGSKAILVSDAANTTITNCQVSASATSGIVNMVSSLSSSTVNTSYIEGVNGASVNIVKEINSTGSSIINSFAVTNTLISSTANLVGEFTNSGAVTVTNSFAANASSTNDDAVKYWNSTTAFSDLATTTANFKADGTGAGTSTLIGTLNVNKNDSGIEYIMTYQHPFPVLKIE